ncbi:CU044_5270 family protein [Thermomonospora amylolytica]|uniref:CU044_5270 family protein n=1 Tax=Thermomonospora amylolytica TaxID=1411117 RepID=UPI000E6B81AC|nr:CU044_5270 family protein [Thermomonospora amylolytica]
MDEITMVRELYGRPEPDPAVRERVRARITGERPARRPRRRMTFGLGLVAAATTAVIAGTNLLGGGTTGGPVVIGTAGGTAGGGDGSARTVLLAAAENAEREQPGRYWRLHTTYADTYRVKEGYNVEGNRWESDEWTARSMDDPDHNFDRDLPSRPQTPADEAAWRRAGSPRTWKVISSGRPHTLTTESTAWRSAITSPEQKRSLTEVCTDGAPADSPADPECGPLAELSGQGRVLTDPDHLKELLAQIRARRASVLEGEPELKKEMAARFDMPIIYGFLTQAATPEVRAEAFRLLADTPGVRSIGTVTDRAGRRGIGLAARATRDDGGTVYDQVIILEPGTYRVLGEQKVVVKANGTHRGMAPGTVLSHTVVHQVGWTNDTPAHP